jgi:phospholipid/cholesterol/gamma-HCH transport system ATP-binding protein
MSLRGLTVRFGGQVALDGVSLSVARGELVGVVGAAGSGKSVLLKCACLLVRPDAGAVELEGTELTALSRDALAQVRARFGFSFQNLALFDQLDAIGNVTFSLVRRGVPEAEATARATAQLKAVGLEAALAKYPHELSGGMRRRLALARAMVSRPDVGLYDDPFVGLDPVACARIARLIERSHRENGGATIVAAGDPAPLLAVAHRLVLLEEGRLVADLKTADFRPESSPAVARYLGGERAA